MTLPALVYLVSGHWCSIETLYCEPDIISYT